MDTNIKSVIDRLIRVLVFPLISVSFVFVTLCIIVSLPFWILTGKTFISWSCNLASNHINYCLKLK